MGTSLQYKRDIEPLEDEELADMAQRGDERATQTLLERYQGFARAKSRGYFLVGAESGDVYQEGMIGLFKAIRDYRTGHNASFRGFAELCITRQIITAIKTATRQKHRALNQYVSISLPRGDDDDGRSVEELLPADESSNPIHAIVESNDVIELQDAMNETLSALERDVLIRYVRGESYLEIAASLGRHEKSVDNAIQRIKRKLEAHLTRRDARDRTVERQIMGPSL